MAKHNVSEAARLVGKARTTLHRHIKNGKLSTEQDADGNVIIDTAELVRVYGLSHGATGSATPPAVDVLQQEMQVLQQENDRLRRELEDVKRDSRERERAHLSIIHEMAQAQKQLTAGAKKKASGGRLFGRFFGRE